MARAVRSTGQRIMIVLTTHVLDQTRGVPAASLRIDLFHLIEQEARIHLASVLTNPDGRTDKPLLQAQTPESGEYEMVFFAGDYFRAQGVSLSDPPFLDKIVIRFGLSTEREHYHVPLLLSPYGYSTYRGS